MRSGKSIGYQPLPKQWRQWHNCSSSKKPLLVNVPDLRAAGYLWAKGLIWSQGLITQRTPQTKWPHWRWALTLWTLPDTPWRRSWLSTSGQLSLQSLSFQQPLRSAVRVIRWRQKLKAMSTLHDYKSKILWENCTERKRKKKKEKEEAHRYIAEADFEQLTPGFWAQKPSAMPLL